MDVVQGQPSNSVPLCLTSLENQKKSAKTSEKICRPTQVWFILESNLQMPEGTTSSVQTIVHKFKHHGTTQLSYRSGGRRRLSPRDEWTLVRKVQINPRTTAKGLVKMLEETGTKVSKSTVKRVLYRHNRKGCSARNKLLLQNRHKKATLRSGLMKQK